MSGALPRGWAELPLADLLREPLRNGHSASASTNGTGIRTLTLTAVTSGDFSEANTKLTIAHPAKVADLWLEPGDILVERSNTPELVGTARLYRGARAFAIFPDLMIRVRLCEGISPGVVEAFLQSTQIRTYFQRAAQGNAGTMPKISQGTIEAVVVLVPPRAEQERLLDAVESYGTRLEDAMVTLERVERNLKRFRASVLKAAVEGRLVPTEAVLTNQGRRTYEPASVLLERILAERRRCWSASGKKGKYEEPTAPDTDSLPELPEGWCWASVEQITTGERSSGYGVLVPGPDVPDGVLLVRVGDIYDGRIHLEGMKRISKDVADQFQRTYLKGGELLLSLVGSIGRTAVVPETLAGANVARAVGVVPVCKLLDCRWVEHWFRSPVNQARIVGLSHEVARKTLNLEDVRRAVVALPPRQEQTRIVESVAGFESLTNKSTSLVELSRQRAARLRQAILKWAFEGKIADQDANDEPASVLLERIKAERAVVAEAKPTAPQRGPKKKQVRA